MGNSTLAVLEVKQLHPHPDNPRKDVGDITELASSIKKNGIMQNLTVIPMDDEMENFMVLIGHRRLAASKQAGIESVPCKILLEPPSRSEQIAIMLEENMQRQDLTILEEAESFQMCLDLGSDMDFLQKKTGFSKTTIQNRLKINKLNKGLVKERLEQEGFNLTLSDLLELGKIEDEAEKERILSMTEYGTFKYSLGNAIRAQIKKKKMNAFAERMNALGVKEAPKGVYPWHEKWEHNKKFSTITEAECEQLMEYVPAEGEHWLNSYDTIYFMKKRKIEKKELSEAEKKRAEKEKQCKQNKLEFEEKWKAFIMKMTDAFEMIYNDELHTDLKKEEVKCALIRLAMDCCVYIDRTYAAWFMASKDIRVKTVTEQERLMSELDNIPVEKILISCIAYFLKDRVRPPMTYTGCYLQKNGVLANKVVKLLSQYGFELTDEELQMLNGTHPLYMEED